MGVTIPGTRGIRTGGVQAAGQQRMRGLGASAGQLTFGSEAGETGSYAQLDAFVEAGGTLIDTADVYAGGRPEEIIGRWLGSREHARDQVVIATKGRFPTDESPNGHGLSRRHLSRALDASLRRFGVDTIDLYQLHRWDPLTPVEETLRFLASRPVTAGQRVADRQVPAG